MEFGHGVKVRDGTAEPAVWTLTCARDSGDSKRKRAGRKSQRQETKTFRTKLRDEADAKVRNAD